MNTIFSKKNKKIFFSSLIISFIILIGIPYLIYKIENPESNSIIFKEPPTLDSKIDNLGTKITIIITANDNYNYVEITLNLYKKNENTPIKSETLRKENLKKGNTYTISYTIKSLSEILNIEKYNYKLEAFA